jgi:hypothetical protein
VVRRLVVGSVAIYLVSLASAALLLPDTVGVLLYPGRNPDVLYPRWVFLALSLPAWLVLAFLPPRIVAAFRAVRDSFDLRPGGVPVRCTPLELTVMGSSLASAAWLWTACAFPAGDLSKRFLIDSVVALVVVGGPVVVGIRRVQNPGTVTHE